MLIQDYSNNTIAYLSAEVWMVLFSLFFEQIIVEILFLKHSFFSGYVENALYAQTNLLSIFIIFWENTIFT